MLKWTRFEEVEKEVNPKCVPVKYLFEPCNYQVVTYIKRASMIMAIMMFYDYPAVQIGMLITLQILDLIRFILTKPYQSQIRNGIGLFQ